MSETISTLTDPYLVKHGDTLSTIAKRSSCSITDLRRFNHIADPNKLEVDQTLYLSERTAYGVSVLFLDALRNPIENLRYQLRFDGNVVQQKTSATGLSPRQVTKDAKSPFEVWIHNADQQWQRLTSTVSGHGHKLITLVSGSVVIKGQTQPHPTAAPTTPVAAAPKPPVKPTPPTQPPLPKPASGASSKNNKRVKTKKAKAPQGQSIVKISIDIPQDLLDYFANYTGKEIAEADWTAAAKDLDCEAAVLKAIAKVESGGRSAFWRLNKSDGAHIPAIMYERHYFSRLTKGKYDATHPDISWPTGYRKRKRLGSKDKAMPDGKVEATDIYSDYASSYLRLINAYQLDADAALKSCSWGKFQVMGSNYETCGEKTLKAFITTMCTSELGQIQLLSGFIQNKPAAWINRRNHKLGKHPSLWEAVKTKNWKMIAFNYNGAGYKTYNYDTQLEKAYALYSKAKI